MQNIESEVFEEAWLFTLQSCIAMPSEPKQRLSWSSWEKSEHHYCHCLMERDLPDAAVAGFIKVNSLETKLVMVSEL
jgi:hypothetical protein